MILVHPVACSSGLMLSLSAFGRDPKPSNRRKPHKQRGASGRHLMSTVVTTPTPVGATTCASAPLRKNDEYQLGVRAEESLVPDDLQNILVSLKVDVSTTTNTRQLSGNATGYDASSVMRHRS